MVFRPKTSGLRYMLLLIYVFNVLTFFLKIPKNVTSYVLLCFTGFLELWRVGAADQWPLTTASKGCRFEAKTIVSRGEGGAEYQDMKMQDMKLTDQYARHETAGHENDGPMCWAWNCRTWNCRTWKMQDIKKQNRKLAQTRKMSESE